MNTTHRIHTLRPLVLAVACLAAGASWAQQVTLVVEPVPTVDPVVSARQQEMALQLARANLSQQGITEPTTGQLALATNDVQALRNSGMGWGQIANSLGLRLGAVVSAANRADKADRLATTTNRPATAGSKAKGGHSGNSNAGGQGAGSSGNQGGGSNAGGGGNSGKGGGGNGGGKGGGKR